MELKYNSDGLIPVITVSNVSGRILMLAYMNEEALKKTLETKRVHYFSRSRNKLWLKGETSGHFQELVSITADCDFDTLLVTVNQIGVACHTGNESCFFNEMIDFGKFNSQVLFDEEKNILARRENPKQGSYTNYLFDSGIDKICKKVGEEASEVIISAKNENKEDFIGEVADLFFHVQMLMAAKNVALEDVFKTISARRQKESNLKKKNVKGEL